MPNRLSRLLSENGAVVLAGSVIGVLAPLLERFGNPPQTGLCIACFCRDLSGALGFHRVDGGQYLRPEIIGLVLGSFLAALLFRELKGRGGSGTLIRFLLGGFAMIGSLSYLGCPVGVLLRLARGNLHALPALAGLAAGVFAGVHFIKNGFFIGRSRTVHPANGWLFPALALGLLALFLFDLRANDASAFFFSSLAPGALTAPLPVSLGAGLVIGFLAQRARFCTIGAIRDPLVMKHYRYLYGVIAMTLTALISNALLGQIGPSGPSAAETVAPIQSAPLSAYVIPLLGMALAGLCFTLADGCALRQLVRTGEGDTDAGFFVLGMLTGAAVVYNFGLAGRPACGQLAETTPFGAAAVLAGLAFAVFIGLALRIGKGEES